MRTRGAAWAGVVVAAIAGGIALAGCTGDDPAPPPTTGSASESSSTSSAPTTSTVSAPEMPPEATEATAAGAEAWVQHWFALLNYATATGDTAPLAAVSGTKCQVCAGTIEDIETSYSNGGRIVGGKVSTSQVLSPPPDVTNLVAVGVTFVEEPAQVVSTDGAVEDIEGSGPTTVDFVLVHEGGTWALRGIGTR